MFFKVLAAFAVLVAVFLIVVACQPAAYRVTRSISIAAPAGLIFIQVNNLPLSQAWSPWVKLDPSAQYIFQGPAAGVGASFTWSGNSQIGAGRQVITESRPPELVRMKVEFLKPMPGTCIADFTFKPDGNHTIVTWSMAGENNFLAKAFCLFVNQDKLIGVHFEEGLANLKQFAEAALRK